MRRFASTLLAAFLSVLAVPTAAQGYPARPIRFVVPFAPGGGNDIIARIVAARLTESLGQQVIVDNRSGASGMIAAEIVAKGTPDGHTVLLSTGGPSTIGPLLTKRAPPTIRPDPYGGWSASRRGRRTTSSRASSRPA